MFVWIWLKACGHTLCLSWQITDFNSKSETITGPCFITVKGRLVIKNDTMISAWHLIVSRTTNVLWYTSKGHISNLCTLCLTDLVCDVCHPGCRQDTDQCALGEYTMMSQTGNGWEWLGTFWNWLVPYWLSSNSAIINRQSGGSMRVHNGIAKLRR